MISWFWLGKDVMVQKLNSMEAVANKNYRIFFWVILALGVFLIFFRLTRGDMVSDDAHYSFRSIDYVDFLSSQFQTTPLQWFGNLPGWSRLSFHDAPPFAFILQHASFALFGVSSFAARLPAALAGLVSLVLIYFLGKELYSKQVGLLSMFLLAVSSYFIWISRIAYLEGVEIACILASLYFFVKSKSNRKYLPLWGMFLGLAFLTKYTSFYLIPVFVIAFLWQRRDVFKRSTLGWLIGGCLLCLGLFLPVIIYNIAMLRTRGHFDMQFAIIFGQSMSDWSNISRSVGTDAWGGLKSIVRTLYEAISPPSAMLYCVSLLLLVYEYVRRKVAAHAFVLLNILFLTVLFVFIGPTVRYLPLYTPFIALAVGYALWSAWNSMKRGSSFLIASRVGMIVLYGIFMGYQVAYAINTNHMFKPFGKPPLSYSASRMDNQGFRELDVFVTELVRDVRPPRPITFADYFHIPSTLESAKMVLNNEQLALFPALIVYDDNMNWFGRFWALERWMKMNYVPVLSLSNVLEQARKSRDMYLEAGVDSMYFITPLGANVIPSESRAYESYGTTLANLLKQNKIKPLTIIRNPRGEDSFAVYLIQPLWKALDVVFPEQRKR